MARRKGERWPSDVRPVRVPAAVLALGLAPRDLGLVLRIAEAFRRRPGASITLAPRELAGLAGVRRSDAARRALERLAAWTLPDGAPLLELGPPRKRGAEASRDGGLRDSIESIPGAIVTIAAPKWLKVQGNAPRKRGARGPTPRIGPIPARNPAESLRSAPWFLGGSPAAGTGASIPACNPAESLGSAPTRSAGTPLALASESQNQNCNCKRAGRAGKPKSRNPEETIRRDTGGAAIRLPERARGTHAARDLLAGLRFDGPPADGHVATPDELRLPAVRERLGVPLEATRTVRTLLARLPWQPIDDALRTVHAARVDGRPIASPAAFFVHLLREAAREHAIEVPRAGPHRAPAPEAAEAIREARA